jgi:hypothetical protein
MHQWLQAHWYFCQKKEEKRRNLYQSIINLSEMWEGPNHLDAPSG